MEKVGQRDATEAQHAVDSCMQEINNLYRQVDSARMEILDLQRKENKPTPKVQVLEELIVGLKVKIEKLRMKARQLMQVAEEKREVYVELAKDRKVLEKLKERQYMNHRRAKMKREQKVVDNLVSMRFRRRE
jgi:flagellar export protein FliJ